VSDNPLPETMRAVTLSGHGPPEMLTLAHVPLPPRRADNDVLVEVHAAGVNPFEAKLRRGWLAGLFPLQPGHVIGSDVAGVVVDKGFDVSEFEVGDRVYGLIDTLRSGSYADYTAVTSFLLRKMPSTLSFAEAATVPMAACTAWYGLVDMAGIGPGSRVLVQAGAGGVGGYAIQIAKAKGAWVATTASPAKADYVRSLGADAVIDYTAGDFGDAVGDIDVVLNVIGGATIEPSYKVLKRGGTLLVVLRGDPVEIENAQAWQAHYGVTRKIVAFSAQPQILDLLRPLFEDGTIRPPQIETLPLEQAPQAHARVDAGGLTGKLVLTVR
jgi:NADPH:quinone reductase-like Zn-dependent oxidoreductase